MPSLNPRKEGQVFKFRQEESRCADNNEWSSSENAQGAADLESSEHHASTAAGNTSVSEALNARPESRYRLIYQYQCFILSNHVL